MIESYRTECGRLLCLRDIEKEELKTSKVAKLPGPLPQSIRAGNLLLIPCGPITPDGALVTEDFELATVQMMENTKTILEEAGSSMDKVIRVDVYLKRIEDTELFNKIYTRYFKEPYPVRSLIQPARTPSDTPCAMVVTALI